MRISNDSALPRSVYIHIPFCHRRCFYCDFAVIPLGDKARGSDGPGSEFINTYLKLLHKEIKLSPKGPPLSTVYIGGGTPSLLTPCQISSLLKNLKIQFGFQCGAEVTLEMDPATFNSKDLELFLEVGINRISLGGQSFDDKVLQQLGRSHCRKDLIEACNWLKKAYKKGDLKTWSLDLIQNLPSQSLEDWQEELSQAKNISPPHLSIYELAIESGTVFEWRQRRGDLFLPEEDLAAKMLAFTSSFLAEIGYSRYEISNYSLPGHQSRHNRVYWSGAGWWAFGQGSTSCPWGIRFTRPRKSKGYRDWVENQQINGPDSSLVSLNRISIPLDEKILVGLRCREGIDLEELAISSGWTKDLCEKYFPALLIRWNSSIKKGWLKKSGNRLQLTDPTGMIFSNQVLVDLFLWWETLPSYVADLPNPLEHL